MARIGYHASHEQYDPRTLCDLARRAEAAGFGAIKCSDHIQPWSPRQGHSGHAWTWLGAAIIIASGLYLLRRERIRAQDHLASGPADTPP